MKLTKKILISLISAAAVAISLAACNANENSPKADSNTASSILEQSIKNNNNQQENKTHSSHLSLDEILALTGQTEILPGENEFLVTITAGDDFTHTFTHPVFDDKSLFHAIENYLIENDIHYEITGFDETAYIAKIDEYGEKTEGNSYTGWTYTVNGEFASVGLGQHYPNEGDIHVLTYSTMTW